MDSSFSNQPQYTRSVESFITTGKTSDDITYNNFSILVKCIGENSIVRYAQDNIIYDYMDELKEKAVTLEFSDADYLKYRYKPKLLSYDIYETTELFFVIMAINGMCNIKDFNRRKIKLFYRGELMDLLTQIYNAESDYITYNRKHLTDGNGDWK